MLENELNYLRAAKMIKNAKSLVLLAGAGMSADSGSETYEEQDKFVRDYPELKNEGILTYQDIAKAKWFSLKPQIAWLYANNSEMHFNKTVPHHGYSIAKSWLEGKHTSFTVTTNVDSAFHKCGFDNILELHGNHSALQCSVNCRNEVWTRDTTANIPLCPFCGATARPNILYFEDQYFCPVRYMKQNEKYQQFMLHSHLRKPVAIEIGAGTLLATLRHQSLLFEHVIRINPDASDDISNERTIHIQETALVALNELNKRM